MLEKVVHFLQPFLHELNVDAGEVLMLNESVLGEHMCRYHLPIAPHCALFERTLHLHVRALVLSVVFKVSSNDLLSTIGRTFNQSLRTLIFVTLDLRIEDPLLAVHALHFFLGTVFFVKLEFPPLNPLGTVFIGTLYLHLFAVICEMNFELVQSSSPRTAFVLVQTSDVHLLNHVESNEVLSEVFLLDHCVADWTYTGEELLSLKAVLAGGMSATVHHWVVEHSLSGGTEEFLREFLVFEDFNRPTLIHYKFSF